MRAVNIKQPFVVSLNIYVSIVVAKQLLDATAVNTATVYTYKYGQKLYRIQICVSITPINLSKDKNKHSQVCVCFV